jgi:pyruvate dehydrogenase kinase 2/3/4
VTIKVSDEGGGIPRSGLARIWTYLYSTAKQRVAVEELQVGLDSFGAWHRGRLV